MLNQTTTGFNISLYFALRPAVAVQALGDLLGMVATRQLTVHISERSPLSEASEHTS